MAVVKIHLEESDIHSLHTSPKLAIKNPGSDKVILVLGGFVAVSISGGAYTDNQQIYVGSLAGTPLFKSPSDCLAQVNSGPFSSCNLIPYDPSGQGEAALYDNDCHIYCMSSNPNNGSTPITVYLVYEIIQLDPADYS